MRAHAGGFELVCRPGRRRKALYGVALLFSGNTNGCQRGCLSGSRYTLQPENLIAAGENRFDGLALPGTEVLEMVMRRSERSGLPSSLLHPPDVTPFERDHFWRCKRSAQ